MPSHTSPRPRKKRPRPGKNIRRKNLNIDQAKLDRVKDLLGARSETEAIDQALDLLLLREELIEGIRRIAGTGGVRDVYGEDEEDEAA